MADRSYPELYAARKWHVGAERTRRGQKYLCVEIKPYVCRDGRTVPIAYLRSQCADCSAPFMFSIPAWVGGVDLNRRCDEHKAQGVYVKPRLVTAPKPRKIKPAEIPLDLFG